MHSAIETPLGPMLAAATPRGLCLLEFTAERLERQLARLRLQQPDAEVSTGNEFVREIAAQLAAYFAGKLRNFSVPLDAAGTAFQRRVWNGLRAIPYGQTESYGALAARIGVPAAVRAVGAANGKNPISIVVPCHRVIGAAGALTGYGGGLWRKRALLELEGAYESAPRLAWGAAE